MGTLVEAIRAGGFGLGGVLTKTGLGTLVEEGKQKVVVKGETYLLQEPLKADVSLIYANRADRMGNLVYHGNSRSHTTAMATAADYVICEVAKIVEIGEIPPNSVHTPAVFVNAVVQKEEK